MSGPTSIPGPGGRRELVAIGAFTLLGGVLRIWALGRLGLVHFDEGIYALAGLWAVSPRGWSEVGPMLVPYAPPGFPFLVGVAYATLGVADTAAILVSVVLGTLTVPLIGWLAWRSFGRGAGAAASALVAFAGPHIAFSRMALTDVAFLWFWLLAIGQGQRFLERPGPGRAVWLGLAVGTAQLFKYNGWLAGALVALAAVVMIGTGRETRSARWILRAWGWGAFSALVAAAVYWPWFHFVEEHGGYAALIAHHRSYLAGPASWRFHFYAQLMAESALSGGYLWNGLAGLAGAIGAFLALDGSGALGAATGRRRALVAFTTMQGLTTTNMVPWAAHWAGLPWCVLLARSRRVADEPGLVLLLTGWATLTVLTPFYHPYARLALPLQSLGWILLGGLFPWLIVRGPSDVGNREQGGTAPQTQTQTQTQPRTAAGRPMPGALGTAPIDRWLVLGCLIAPVVLTCWFWKARPPSRMSAVLAPSDSLRRGCRELLKGVPKGPSGLRLLARPSVTFYLSGAVSLYPQPDREALLAPPGPGRRAWALLDAAVARPGPNSGPGRRPFEAPAGWDVLMEIPTDLNLPTLLDVEPSMAWRPAAGRSAPLRLLRSR